MDKEGSYGTSPWQDHLLSFVLTLAPLLLLLSFPMHPSLGGGFESVELRNCIQSPKDTMEDMVHFC